MITLKEIAQRCQVSTATVSNILNGKPKVSEETKERVLKVIKDTGYQPNYFAQGIRKRKTNIIGVMVEDMDLFSSPKIIEGIMSYVEKYNYRTILVNMRLYNRWGNSWYNQEERYQSIYEPSIQELLSIKVDGIIYVAGHARMINCFADDFNLPIVMAYGYSKSNNITSVVIDDEMGGFDATRYLISMGHRKIGVVGGDADNIHTVKRILGYQRALFEGHILYNPNWVVYGDWTRDLAYKMAEGLVNEGVTAIFCLNDSMVVGVYDYLEEKKLVPGKDIAIIGYDNRDFASYVKPGITTMEIPLITIGEKAAGKIISLLELEEDNQENKVETNNIEGEEIKVLCKLIERESVHFKSKTVS